MKLNSLNIPQIDLRQISYPPLRRNKNFSRSLYDNYFKEVIEDAEDGKKLVLFLSQDSRLRELNEKLKRAGILPFEPKIIAAWFIWYANKTDKKNAQEKLNAWLESNQNEFIDALWVLGVKTEQTIQINESIKIVPVSKMPLSNEQWQFSQLNPSDFSSPLQPEAAIVINSESKPIVFDESLEDREHLDSVDKIYDVAHMLNAIADLSCVAFLRAKYRLPHIPPGPFDEISGRKWQQHEVSIRHTSRISDNISFKLMTLLNAYWKLSQKEKERIDIILNRLLKTKNSLSITDKILEIAIALEMMLLDENKTDQLSLSFRLRGAWLIGKDAEQRLKIYKNLKNLYTYRSQAAHTGQLCSGKPKKIQVVRDEMPYYLKIGESIFEHLLINGKPDWDCIILNANHTLKNNVKD